MKGGKERRISRDKMPDTNDGHTGVAGLSAATMLARTSHVASHNLFHAWRLGFVPMKAECHLALYTIHINRSSLGKVMTYNGS